MLLINIIFFIITIFLNINIGRCTVTVNAIAFTYDTNGEVYSFIVKDFNDYSKENNLDIILNLNLFTPSNSTTNINDYGSMVEQLLTKRSERYDIYFYDNIYSTRFGSHFLNLEKILDEDHIKMYNEDVISLSCTYNGVYVGLPVTLDYTVLYSNSILLEKYNKTIPTTWDELIETGKYIKERENNSDLIVYNGAFATTEIGTCSLYEFIYSCRDTKESEFPELTSETAIKAIEKIKEIKEEISSDSTYQMSYFIISDKLAKADLSILFIKYWYSKPSSSFIKFSPLPGLHEGVSGSTIGGYNIAITKYSNMKKRNEVIKVFKYITSKDMQRKLILEKALFSLIPSLYNEKDLCEKVDCEFYKKIQLIPRPTTVTDDYSIYSEQFRGKIYEYLFGEKKASEVMSELEDISKIYYITLRSNSSIGLIFLIVIIILSIIMLSSLILPSVRKYKNHFKFQKKETWYMIVLGLVIIMNSSFIELGEKTEAKCQFRYIILSYGVTLVYVPILYRLIINFPAENMLSNWVKDHQFWMVYIFMIIDTILGIGLLLVPYDVEKVIVPEGKNYEECKLNNNTGLAILIIMLVIKFIIFIGLTLLVFIEWNMTKTIYDIRLISGSLFIVFFSGIIQLIINKLGINYIDTYITHSIIYIALSLSNYVLLYGIRVVYMFKPVLSEEDKMMEKIHQDKSKSSTTDQKLSSSDTSNSASNSRSSIAYHKILNFHFQKN
ncbi:periplasmic binding protein-like II [Anaeromyces robustus]|uniref:Periplasmic binding protein-like II n=1 Tax=Anaeromyces robustus TaxID=1754192 RepID=A0A1Y1X2U6_9FUNG|nr:periplasmic binding protein-like II [Anaeromyces robustus]|eukprot:ORX80130.1 periplasmic binding protein-like II [Anaeromyces robustus]